MGNWSVNGNKTKETNSTINYEKNSFNFIGTVALHIRDDGPDRRIVR